LNSDQIQESDIGDMIRGILQDDSRSIPPPIPRSTGKTCEVAYQPYDALTRQIELKVASQLEVLLEARIEETSSLDFHGRKLSSRHLSRVATSVKPRCFRRDHDVQGVSTAVTVLLDVSGSMANTMADGQNQRIHAAVSSARAAIQAMDRHEVPCSMYFFGEKLTPVKSFSDSWRKVRNLHWGLLETDTRTGHAIEAVIPELCIQEEERKLLLLMTDGIPNDPIYACATLQEAQRCGVEVAILLIMSGDRYEAQVIKEFQGSLVQAGIPWIEVSSTDQLADGLINAIKNSV
jgi:nitric oxide reductase activation protein